MTESKRNRFTKTEVQYVERMLLRNSIKDMRDRTDLGKSLMKEVYERLFLTYKDDIFEDIAKRTDFDVQYLRDLTTEEFMNIMMEK